MRPGDFFSRIYGKPLAVVGLAVEVDRTLGLVAGGHLFVELLEYVIT
jgi:hypothetical protein